VTDIPKVKAPIAFIRADGGEGSAWCCGTCGVYCDVDENYARYHCGGQPCELCGAPSQKFRIKCEDCIRKERHAQECAAIEKAKKISAEEYCGPVFWDERDEYYPDAETAWDAITDDFCADVDGAREQTVWCCDVMSLVLNAENIINDALAHDEHHDDAWEAMSNKALKEFQEFCEHWNEVYGSQVESWYRNSDLIVFPEKWWEQYVKDIAELQE